MEFFIKQNSNLPILKMDVVRDGRTESWKNFYDVLDNATIRFSMKSENDGIQKIFMRPAYITEKERTNPDSPREYYIYYKWRGKDTAKKGRFIGPSFLTLLGIFYLAYATYCNELFAFSGALGLGFFLMGIILFFYNIKYFKPIDEKNS